MVPATRQARAALGAAVAAVSLSAAIAAWLAVEAGATARWPVAGLALAGTAALPLALLWAPALTAVVALPGAAYATLLVLDDPPLDGRAALLAAGLVVTAGLADWSLELRTTSPDEPGGRWTRLAWIAVGGLATVAVCGAMLAAVDLVRAEGVAVQALGAVAALAALALLVALARDRPPPRA